LSVDLIKYCITSDQLCVAMSDTEKQIHEEPAKQEQDKEMTEVADAQEEEEQEGKGNKEPSKKAGKSEEKSKASATSSRPTRHRKAVERFKEEPKEAKEIVIPKGEGVKLGDISKVVERFQELPRTAPVFTDLHRILFGRPGSTKNQKIKENLLEFSGLVYHNKEAERKKLIEKLNNYKLPAIKEICYVLNLERSGGKEEIVNRLIDFLEKPAPQKGSTPSKPSKKRARPSKEKKKKEKKGKVQKEKVTEEEESDEGESESEESAESDYEEKKKPKKKGKPRKKVKKVEEKSESEAEKPASDSEVAQEEVQEEVQEEAEKSDKGNEVKEEKENKAATDDQIVKQLELLITADPQITMRIVKEKLSEHFGVDLSDRKDFIKEKAAQIIEKVNQ
jgi:protein DEK